MAPSQPDDEDVDEVGAIWLVIPLLTSLLALPCLYLDWRWVGLVLTLVGTVIVFRKLAAEALITPLLVFGNLGGFVMFSAMLLTNMRPLVSR